MNADVVVHIKKIIRFKQQQQRKYIMCDLARMCHCCCRPTVWFWFGGSVKRSSACIHSHSRVIRRCLSRRSLANKSQKCRSCFLISCIIFLVLFGRSACGQSHKHHWLSQGLDCLLVKEAWYDTITIRPKVERIKMARGREMTNNTPNGLTSMC